MVIITSGPKIRYFLLIFLLLLSPATAYAGHSKAKSVAVVLKALDKVYELSGRRETIEEDKRFDKEFVPYLRSIKDPDDLAQLSVACFNISYPGNAGDDDIDAYFDRCFTLALIRLSEIRGRAAQNALKSIKDRIQLDGAASLDYKSALEVQSKINSTKP